MTRHQTIAALLSAALLLSATAQLAGCNTTEGLGKDVKAAGSSLEQSARREKTY
jgi:predicted small secreted protein